MKYTYLTCLIFLLIFSSIIFAEDLNVKIIYVEGKVSVIKNGDVTWAEVGQIVKSGDKILTSGKSVCDLEFAPFTYSRIGENSDIVLGESQLEPKRTLFGTKMKKKIRLNLNKGNILSKLKKIRGGESFAVKTPVAVVGVRGTIFNAAHGTAGTNVSVFQGSVTVTNIATGAKVSVAAGQSLSVEAGSGKTESKSVSPAEMKQVEASTGASVEAAPVITSPTVNVTEQLVNTTSTPITTRTTKSTVTINFSK